MTLKAIVLRNPWAPLVVLGIKQWELRGFQPRTTLYGGDDLAIVMGRTADSIEDYPAAWDRYTESLHARLKSAMRCGADADQLRAIIDWGQPGHVLGVVRYEQSLPVHPYSGLGTPGDPGFQFKPGGYPSRLCLVEDNPAGGCRWVGMEDQADLGHWVPGNHAWALTRPRRLIDTVPCPAVNDDGRRLIMQGVFTLPASVESAVRARLP